MMHEPLSSAVHRGGKCPELSQLGRANESPAGAERGLDGDVGGCRGCKVPACSIHTIAAARLQEQNGNITVETPDRAVTTRPVLRRCAMDLVFGCGEDGLVVSSTLVGTALP